MHGASTERGGRGAGGRSRHTSPLPLPLPFIHTYIATVCIKANSLYLETHQHICVDVACASLFDTSPYMLPFFFPPRGGVEKGPAESPAPPPRLPHPPTTHPPFNRPKDKTAVCTNSGASLRRTATTIAASPNLASPREIGALPKSTLDLLIALSLFCSLRAAKTMIICDTRPTHTPSILERIRFVALAHPSHVMPTLNTVVSL